MDNNNDHINSNENDTLQKIVFKEWPLDEDDQEFRAGYPFTPVPFEEMNDTWYDSSPTYNDDDFQSVNPQNNDCNKTTKENDGSSCLSFVRQEEFMKFDVNSSGIHDDNNDHNVNTNQKQDDEEGEQNQYDQYSIVKTDIINENQINQAHPAK